jgi:hypothetical protein
MSEIQEIIGKTQGRKNGLVISSDKDYFVIGKDSWEEELFDKTVKVRGIVSKTKNNSVLPPTDDGIIRQGIPTNSWEEYQAINHQYWIEIKEIEVIE